VQYTTPLVRVKSKLDDKWIDGYVITKIGNATVLVWDHNAKKDVTVHLGRIRLRKDSPTKPTDPPQQDPCWTAIQQEWEQQQQQQLQQQPPPLVIIDDDEQPEVQEPDHQDPLPQQPPPPPQEPLPGSQGSLVVVHKQVKEESGSQPSDTRLASIVD